MDYSENLHHKYEAQSAHFSERQFSLHCKVMHTPEEKNKHIYHLSDDTLHDSYFSIAVIIKDLGAKYSSNNDVVRFKSDNCCTQHKSCYIFYQLNLL